MKYPLWMAKGDRDKPEAVTVRSEEEEIAARADGYVSGHEFYSDEMPDPTTEELEASFVEDCQTCNGTGKDPSDKRRKCPSCKA